MDKKKSIAKSIFGITGIVLLTKVISFLRELIYSTYFGTSAASDAYYTANIVPNLINTPYFTGMLMFFVPTYLRVRNDKGSVEADRYTSNTISVYTTISTLLSVLLVLLSPAFVQLLGAVSMTADGRHMATLLMRLSCVSFPISMLTWIYVYLCHASNDFTIPQGIFLAHAVISALGLAIMGKHGGIYAVPISALVAWGAQFLLQFMYSKRYYRHCWMFDLRSEYIRQSLLLAVPVFISTAAEQLNHTVDNLIALHLSAGSISVLNYSQKVFNLLNSFLPLSVITVMYPALSQAYGDKREWKNVANQTARLLLELIVPVAVICEACGTDLIQVIFMRGSFTYSDVTATAGVLRMYALALPFWGIREWQNRIFFARADSKTPMATTLASVLVNIALSVFLSRFFGMYGVAIATAISCALTCVMNRVLLRAALGGVSRETIAAMRQTGAAAAAMAIAAYGAHSLTRASAYLSLIASSVLGIALYAAVLIELKNEDACRALEWTKRLIRKNTEDE